MLQPACPLPRLAMPQRPCLAHPGPSVSYTNDLQGFQRPCPNRGHCAANAC